MDEQGELHIRHVMDIDSIKDDPPAWQAFVYLITYLYATGSLNVTIQGTRDPELIISMVMELLIDKVVVMASYGDPQDITQWKLEPNGPPDTMVLPLDINLN